MAERWKEVKDPDLRLAGFSLWVFGRQYEDAQDYWDGNWLNVHAEMETNGATVKANGAILHLSELTGFVGQLEILNNSLTGEAALKCLEPNLGMVIRAQSLGHLDVMINITPDHMTERHEFVGTIDQTYLGPLLTNCRRILENFPLRGV